MGNIKHGHSTGSYTSSTYKSWSRMKGRCLDKKNIKFAQYGGKGITICDRWKNFKNFLEDMGERPEGASIDRIDSGLGYFKENCRWSDIKDQNRNRKSCINLTFKGRTRNLAEWSEVLGVKYSTIYQRYIKGYPIQFVLSSKNYKTTKSPWSKNLPFSELRESLENLDEVRRG